MKSSLKFSAVLLAAFLLAGVVWVSAREDEAPARKVERLPRLLPDYTGTVIPPNIAPLNFKVLEKGTEFQVTVTGSRNGKITLNSDDGKVIIPRARWRSLLERNRGRMVTFLVKVKKDGQWQVFKPVENKIALEDIDPFVTYRLVMPQFGVKNNMQICQRNLTSFDEYVLFNSRSNAPVCVNCHTPARRSGEKFILHVRSTVEGKRYKYMAVAGKDKLRLIDPSTKITRGATFASWHPSGNIIAFTANYKVKVPIYLGGQVLEETWEYVDQGGDIALYRMDSNTVTTNKKIASKDRYEMFPVFSPDGRYMYYISEPSFEPSEYPKGKADLMRISYDSEKNEWGEPEVLISAKKAGLGVTFPKISPDGKYLLFCMLDHGTLAILRKSSDLYLMNIKTGKYRKLKVNSNRADSWHTWSSNSRWFAFVSRGFDGMFGKIYISHLDENGNESKPFLMPQKDPTFYLSFTRSYNIPEFTRDSLDENRTIFSYQIRQVDEIRRVKGAREIDAVTSATVRLLQGDPDTGPKLPAGRGTRHE